MSRYLEAMKKNNENLQEELRESLSALREARPLHITLEQAKEKPETAEAASKMLEDLTQAREAIERIIASLPALVPEVPAPSDSRLVTAEDVRKLSDTFHIFNTIRRNAKVQTLRIREDNDFSHKFRVYIGRMDMGGQALSPEEAADLYNRLLTAEKK